jgi:hypothetical protein
VARNDNSRGSVIWKTGFGPFRVPIVSSENGTGLAV